MYSHLEAWRISRGCEQGVSLWVLQHLTMVHNSWVISPSAPYVKTVCRNSNASWKAFLELWTKNALCFHGAPFGELSTKVILLSWSTQRKSSCFRGALNKSHHDPAFVELPMKYTLLLQQSFDNQEFPRLLKNKVFVAKICIYALFESFDGLFCGHQEPANPSYPVSHPKPICISTQLLDWFAILWNGNPFDLQSF